MLGISKRHALAGDTIFFDPKGDRAAPGEITNGFADLQLRDVDMRDENLGTAPIPHTKGAYTPRVPSYRKPSLSISEPPQRCDRKAFSLLINTPVGGGVVGKKDIFVKKCSGGVVQETSFSCGKIVKLEKRRCNPVSVLSQRVSAAAVVKVQEDPVKAGAETDDDKENQTPAEALLGVDVNNDGGRDGELFEQAETTIRYLREQGNKDHEAAGDENGLLKPILLEVAKSQAIPGVRFRQGALGELSVGDLYSTGERVSIPSKGIAPTDGGAHASGSGVPHLMTEEGRAEVKVYLSSLPSVFCDPNVRDDRKTETEDELVDMFLNLHFGDDWLDNDTVITRAPKASLDPALADYPRDASYSRTKHPTKRYCASSSDNEGSPKATILSLVQEEQQQQSMRPPLLSIRRDASAAACGTRPIPIHKGRDSFLKFRERGTENRCLVSESEGEEDMCRSFESVSTQPGTYGTSGHEHLALDGLHIGCTGGRLGNSPSAGEEDNEKLRL